MKNKILYQNFLEDRRIYNLNRGYWKKILKSLNQEAKSFPLYNEHFNNGTPFYDGNPMISAAFPSLQKSVRIIQEEVETIEGEITAWVEEVEHEDGVLQELVLSLELSRLTAKIAKKILHGWIVKNWNRADVDELLEGRGKALEESLAGLR